METYTASGSAAKCKIGKRKRSQRCRMRLNQTVLYVTELTLLFLLFHWLGQMVVWWNDALQICHYTLWTECSSTRAAKNIAVLQSALPNVYLKTVSEACQQLRENNTESPDHTVTYGHWIWTLPGVGLWWLDWSTTSLQRQPEETLHSHVVHCFAVSSIILQTICTPAAVCGTDVTLGV